MIYSYGISQTGLSHIEKGIICQDAHCIKKTKTKWVIAAVADGVGSAKHSDIASSMAVKTIADYCSSNIIARIEIKEIERILSEAYSLAQKLIEEKAEEDGNSITEYDTTLSTVVYDGKNLIYAHSGDGGIVGLSPEGKYIRITLPQKGRDGICVIPLRAGVRAWEIGHYNGEIVSVLLATDGVYDTLYPYLLRGTENEVNVPLIRSFMDNTVIQINKQNLKEIKEERSNFLLSDACSIIRDDKTVVVLINNEIEPKMQPESYYNEPDWDLLQKEWNKKTYPHLFK